MKHSNQASSKAILGMALALCLPTAAQASDWDWAVAPYLWLAGYDIDVHTDVPPSGAANDREFPDLLENLDGAFMIHGEGQGDQFGILADFMFLGLSDGTDRPNFDISSDLDARVFDLAGVWSPGPERYHGFELLAGLRYIDLDFEVGLDPVNPAFNNVTIEAGDTFTDFLIGGRYTWALNERWGLTVRGDTSFGDTEGSFNVAGTLLYRTNNGAWTFGYRYMTAEFQTGPNNTDVSLYGPMVGYVFAF
jgi:hypothetical protein